MRYFQEHTRRFAWRLFQGLREARLRDPLVQVWLLAAGFLLLSVFLLRPESGNPLKRTGATLLKNENSGMGMLLRSAGAGAGWSDSFGEHSGEDAASRPPVKLPLETPGKPPEPVAEARVFEDLRPEMREASRRPWRFLSRDIREAVNTRSPEEFRGLQVDLTRSGAATGGARLLSWKGEAGPESPHFIIGNGSHTADGFLETGPGWRRNDAEALQTVRVCFVGNVSAPLTPAQRAAAGELLNYLEMRLGTVSFIIPEN